MSTSPIIIGHHLMWTLYGWWLPNDPRGSTSQVIRNDLIAALGELHFGRKKVQPAGSTLRQFYQEAQPLLKFPLLSFAPGEFAAVASAIGSAIAECNYTCYACAIMPDHVHLLIRKHRDLAEEMIAKLQSLSRERLVRMRPTGHPLWTRGGWKVFLDHPDVMQRTIQYIQQNPVKMYLPSQRWPFVVPYDNWPLHPGHSPKSPYVRALRSAGRHPR